MKEPLSLFTLKKPNGSLNISQHLENRLLDLIDFNRSQKLTLDFQVNKDNKNILEHLECNPSLLFFIYRKDTNLKYVKYPQLDFNQLKAFL